MLNWSKKPQKKLKKENVLIVKWSLIKLVLNKDNNSRRSKDITETEVDRFGRVSPLKEELSSVVRSELCCF